MKIKKIKINNYRSFREEKHISFDTTGKNLFICGENGSGKSSFCRALNTFFDASDKRRTESIASKILRKPFKNQPLFENYCIQVEFSDGNLVSFDKDGYNIEDIEFLSQIRRMKGFLEYKNLLPIYLNSNREKYNLFRIFVEGPFSKLRNPKTNLQISTEWSADKKVNLSTEFYQGISQLATSLEEKINIILKYFIPNVEISFKSRKTWTTGELYLNVKVDDHELINYGDYFNEAKLVALSISIYLSVILKQKEQYDNSKDDDLKVLILDDIFIGMDMSNRIPLLKVLQDLFNDYQVIITSFDDSWYNLSKFYLGEKSWKFVKIFSNSENQSTPQSFIFDDYLDDYEEKARLYYKKFDYPACANYQRKAFEKKIKNILPFNLLHHPTEEGEIKKNGKMMSNFNNLIKYLSDCKLDTDVFNEFKLYTKILLNPLSHDNSESPIYRKEIEVLFSILDEMNKIENKILKKVSTKENSTLIVSINGSDDIWYNYKYELVDNLRRIKQGDKIGYAPCRVILLKTKVGTEPWVDKKGEKCVLLSKVYKNLCSTHHIVEPEDYSVVFKTNKGIPIAEL